MKRVAGLSPISIGDGNDFGPGDEVPDAVWGILTAHRQRILLEQRRVVEVPE